MPSQRALPPPSLPRPPAVPADALRSYSTDAEDDAPTRLYGAGTGSAPPPPRTLPRVERPAPLAPAPAPVEGSPHTKKILVGFALIAAIAVAAAYVLYLRPGALTITVTGPGGRAIDGLSIYVDGEKRCDASPCRIQGLSTGVHLVRASATGYQDAADQAVSINAGQQSTQNLSLSPVGAGTAIRVSSVGSGLKLYIDGQEIGELPQTAKNLAPGDHTVRVAGNDRYEPFEEHVTVADGETKTIGPLRLRVLKGLATFKAGPGADGARVLLDGRLVPELPATIEVPAGKQLMLVATKNGYSTYRRVVSFDDGIAEKSFEITMVEGSSEGGGSSTVAASAPAAPQHGSAPASRTAASPAKEPVATARGGKKAVLNMNSIPVSNVILNGRPLGATPKIGVQVDPGPQTVVFVHPQLGRKVMSANVASGETKTFMARLQ